MATIQPYHVMPAVRDGWVVLKHRARRATRHFDTKQAAVDFARELSKEKGTELFIHRRDGRVADHHAYGADPRPLRDW